MASVAIKKYNPDSHQACASGRYVIYVIFPQSEVKFLGKFFSSEFSKITGDYNAKLSDFGLAKLGPAREDSRVTKLEEEEVIERYVYAAPEYIATGHLYVKSDVYGFGVILLEMLTGLQALTCSSSQQNLVEWARPWLHDKRKLRTIMDPRLEARYPMKAATQTAELTLKCLESYHEARPSMDEVLATLEHIDTIREKKKEAKASTSSGPPFH
ncbi:probable serine/threonine-protein kinase PIX13 [Eucalyptus grandis]|uniref:probable serine/threonine-protein kinase PIX13 n=1 Tax=Eucalyptus grandis TaxID=71139 RepID=UPI00192EC4FB|nr:probable serine/threonine-protein kinase PIX13 [Eucalyptus grandis]